MDITKGEPNERESRRPRRPYQPPCIEETGTFERLMLDCTSLPHTPCDDDEPSS